MDITSIDYSILLENSLPVIPGMIDFSGVQTRKFESPLDAILPEHYICGQNEINYCLLNARKSHESGQWRNSNRLYRKKILLNWADSLQAEADSLALMDCLQTGRSLKSLQSDSIPKAVEALRWFAELTDKIEDRSVSEGHESRYLTVIKREPLGVVAVILPWNDPLVVFIWKVAPALICGNAVVVKSSEYASYSLVKAVKLGIKAGIPENQLQLLTGDASTGAILVQHASVDGLSFTGSSSTGQNIASQSAIQQLKRISLECGGKSSFIVSDLSHKIRQAAKCLAKNAFYNQGQICSAPTRAYIHHGIYDEFIDELIKESANYQPSHPIQGTSSVGYMINRQAVKSVNDFIHQAINSGWQYSSIGSVSDLNKCITPTIFFNIPEADPLSVNELFGPVLIVNKVNHLNEAVARANNSEFGLAAGFWTDDLDETMLISSKLEAGTVHINSYGEDGMQIPFGGIKNSGLGKEKSIDTLLSYSYTKSICMRLNTSLSS